jgi:hypothetical protein
MIEWKSKSKRVFGYGSDLFDTNGCLQHKYRGGGKHVLRFLVQAQEEEYLPSPNAAENEVGVHIRSAFKSSKKEIMIITNLMLIQLDIIMKQSTTR